ncbi:MAG: Fis family transcriptional regulator [Holosporaceae bacterium]|jgi:two-component system nitrogen regulation response regulator GlnG|nr:Fis family transcriptional regulator [Holosporaceae bacterium]
MSDTTVSTVNSEVGFSKIVEKHLDKYFAMHKDGDIPPGVYHRVVLEVERALFNVALKYSNGNHLKAAKVLGINRNTLRKKMANLKNGHEISQQ